MNRDGIHRAKLWQIGGFALNNTATNLYLFFMNFISYYLVGYIARYLGQRKAMLCMYGLLIIGLICNLIAMKFYPLTKEKMESIQTEIAKIKKRAESAKA